MSEVEHHHSICVICSGYDDNEMFLLFYLSG